MYASDDLLQRWFKMSFCEQMAHIGSEVKRAERHETARARALELIGFTKADERWDGHKQREIRQLWLILMSAHETNPLIRVTYQELNKYFLPFVQVVRR